MMVYDVQRDAMIEVTPAEARAGMVRYARSLGAGSAACGVWEQRAMADQCVTCRAAGDLQQGVTGLVCADAAACEDRFTLAAV